MKEMPVEERGKVRMTYDPIDMIYNLFRK